jgi:hypothetical protein
MVCDTKLSLQKLYIFGDSEVPLSNHVRNFYPSDCARYLMLTKAADLRYPERLSLAIDGSYHLHTVQYRRSLSIQKRPETALFFIYPSIATLNTSVEEPVSFPFMRSQYRAAASKYGTLSLSKTKVRNIFTRVETCKFLPTITACDTAAVTADNAPRERRLG